MDKQEALQVLLLLTARDWLGRPKLKSFNGLKLPSARDLSDYIELGPRQAAANGIDIGTIEKIAGYVCTFCEYYSKWVCPNLPKQ